MTLQIQPIVFFGLVLLFVGSNILTYFVGVYFSRLDDDGARHPAVSKAEDLIPSPQPPRRKHRARNIQDDTHAYRVRR